MHLQRKWAATLFYGFFGHFLRNCWPWESVICPKNISCTETPKTKSNVFCKQLCQVLSKSNKMAAFQCPFEGALYFQSLITLYYKLGDPYILTPSSPWSHEAKAWECLENLYFFHRNAFLLTFRTSVNRARKLLIWSDSLWTSFSVYLEKYILDKAEIWPSGSS